MAATIDVVIVDEMTGNDRGRRRVVADITVTTTATEGSINAVTTLGTGVNVARNLLQQLGLRKLDMIAGSPVIGIVTAFCTLWLNTATNDIFFVGSSNTVGNNLVPATQNKAAFTGRVEFVGRP